MIAYNYNVRKIQEYTDQAVTLNKKIDDVQDYATKQGADFTKNNTTTALKHNAPATRTSAVANNDAKRIEKEKKERERKFKEEMKNSETEIKTDLLEIDAQYTSGQIKYTEYIKQRLEALQSGYDTQLAILKKYGKTESSEYNNIIAQKNRQIQII